MIMLTTLNSLKLRLKLEEFDTKDDDLLTNFIKLVSGRFERFCNRSFARREDATCEFRGDEVDLRVDRYPIESVSAFHLKSDEGEGWVAEVADYLISASKSMVTLHAPLGSSRQLLRVTFDGGYVLPGETAEEGQAALPDEIEQSCIEECVRLWQQRNHPGLVGISAEGGSIQKDRGEFLPHVQEVLLKYQRYVN